jgi:hypothetical protein
VRLRVWCGGGGGGVWLNITLPTSQHCSGCLCISYTLRARGSALGE